MEEIVTLSLKEYMKLVKLQIRIDMVREFTRKQECSVDVICALLGLEEEDDD